MYKLEPGFNWMCPGAAKPWCVLADGHPLNFVGTELEARAALISLQVQGYFVGIGGSRIPVR